MFRWCARGPIVAKVKCSWLRKLKGLRLHHPVNQRFIPDQSRDLVTSTAVISDPVTMGSPIAMGCARKYRLPNLLPGCRQQSEAGGRFHASSFAKAEFLSICLDSASTSSVYTGYVKAKFEGTAIPTGFFLKFYQILTFPHTQTHAHAYACTHTHNTHATNRIARNNFHYYSTCLVLCEYRIFEWYKYYAIRHSLRDELWCPHFSNHLPRQASPVECAFYRAPMHCRNPTPSKRRAELG